ncbi:hypothetical protein SPRG_08470 [Saprolegnia parasitica CBS 223.65]|uniref:Uncharacterized protein n=1 Tax=Saprolegnia parasitica (strain CBS 223.65) TaxID=695850 RepID=A0A067C5S3_SAPPC|nr:hypothetical protein SPRG_08470 [Saprolegnia parasitica CBS 223.65]KDO26109.1 hypothetical protein SPRG_08470 [Saprolegnia parasitica CBS 223.65]|eukprot:XP_012203105.1 hypothetical protein SPRG_08470 [Saprolegnia parasitica CBS 223.65]
MTALRELSTLDPSLTYARERRFQFAAAGSVVILQDIAHVGGTVWDAGVVLSHYLDTLGSITMKGKRLVELGAGTALPSIIAARLGANVVATDMSDVLPYTNAAIAANTTQCDAIQAVELVWGRHGAGLKAIAHRACDYIVAADVVYNETYFDALQETLRALSSPATRILICFEQRRRDLGTFWASCAPTFTVTRLSSPLLDACHAEAKIQLFELRSRSDPASV